MKGDLFDSSLLVKSDYPDTLSNDITVTIVLCALQTSCISVASPRNHMCLLGRMKSCFSRGVVKRQLTCKLVILPCDLSLKDIRGQLAHESTRALLIVRETKPT